MLFKLRLPNGSKKIEIDDAETFERLLATISDESGIPSSQITIKAGYPPQAVDPADLSTTLAEIPSLKSGDTLIVSTNVDAAFQQQQSFSKESFPKASVAETQNPESTQSTKTHVSDLSSLQKAADSSAKYSVKTGSGYLVMRDIPDDNSCLFRAMSYVVHGTQEHFYAMRNTIRDVILANPDKYTDAILGKPPHDYCNWIMLPTSWGGAIEIGILSMYYNVEVVAVDIKTLNPYRFGASSTVVVLLYNGVHYNAVAFNSSIANSAMQQDVTVFPTSDNLVINGAVALAKLIQQDHGYTDTTNFKIKCLVCNAILVGEKSAQLHAKQTGHTNLTEI